MGYSKIVLKWLTHYSIEAVYLIKSMNYLHIRKWSVLQKKRKEMTLKKYSKKELLQNNFISDRQTSLIKAVEENMIKFIHVYHLEF